MLPSHIEKKIHLLLQERFQSITELTDLGLVTPTGMEWIAKDSNIFF